jgi:hypothetical protein
LRSRQRNFAPQHENYRVSPRGSSLIIGSADDRPVLAAAMAKARKLKGPVVVAKARSPKPQSPRYSRFKAYDVEGQGVCNHFQPTGPLRFRSSYRLLNARHLGFPTNVLKIKGLVQTVDQEVGGSNPPNYTKKINNLRPPLRPPLPKTASWEAHGNTRNPQPAPRAHADSDEAKAPDLG